MLLTRPNNSLSTTDHFCQKISKQRFKRDKVPREGSRSAPQKKVTCYTKTLNAPGDTNTCSQLAGSGISNSTDQLFSRKSTMMEHALIERSSTRK